jgi:hypothetical protein
MRKELDQRPGHQAFVLERETDYDPIVAFLFLGEFLFSTHEKRRNLVLIFSGPEKSINSLGYGLAGCATREPWLHQGRHKKSLMVSAWRASCCISSGS